MSTTIIDSRLQELTERGVLADTMIDPSAVQS